MSQKETHPAFEFITQHYIESLSINVEHYRHKVTGAEYYHLAADDPQNVFMVALRTVPMDSTGVAHILEHTVLCGSEKYPVRDPFFMMIRRSLNTFMNAFTSSDWTAYPFATENRKDFQNLLQVYMDAVFFPNLDELDFAQEGHRFEFEEMTDPSSRLTYKGVVFNEMKGAMSSPVSVLWQTLTSELYPTSTYHYNSGGEPVDIPDLTYQQLVDFHQQHYHPSNAVFMTYGDIDAEVHQAQFEQLALSRFEDQVAVIKVPSEQRLTQPKTVEASYAFNEEDLTEKTHIVLSWLLGENNNPLDVLKAHLLSAVLLDNSASPLRKVLENTELANAPSPLCGLEDSNKEMFFAAGVQGSEPQHAEAIEQLILDELQRVATEGVEPAHVEAMLHQLELSQREIGGDHYPYGLQLILQALSGAMHDGDPIALLDTDEILKQLADEVKQPDFIPSLIQEWILDNPHRVRLTMTPDQTLAEIKDQAEKAKLEQIKAQLDDLQKQQIIDQAVALEQRQAQEDDPSLLPEVTKDDVPTEIKQQSPKIAAQTKVPVTAYETGTNGLAYQQLIIDMPDLNSEEQAVLPLFNSCLTELGFGGRDYLQTQEALAALTGGIEAKTSIRSHLNQVDQYHSYFVLSGKALDRNQASLAELLHQALLTSPFDELSRIKDLVSQIRSSLDQGVTGSGHSHAMRAASQNFSPVAKWQFERSGFAGIQAMKSLYDAINQDDAEVEKLANHFCSIRSKLLDSRKQALLIVDEKGLQSGYETLIEQWSDLFSDSADSSGLALSASHQPVKQAWLTSTQVNFCAKAFPAVSFGHKDAPKLNVLSACLRNGFLHSAIREKGGAYGGGASFNAESAAFCFYSYRDPRLMETFDDFDRAMDWLNSSEATQQKVDEAILNVISAMDKPGSPAGEARKAFYQGLYGRDLEVLMRYRQGVLSTTLEDLRSVAQKYLSTDNASLAVLTHEGLTDKLEQESFEILQL